jgi:ketosteroid isomerase-like protein
VLPEQNLLKRAYDAFNRRDIAGALAVMHPDVEWPNGMEGGTVYGHSGVRQYWTRQWALINPHVEPVHFRRDEAGRTVVSVHQVVRDLAGHLVLDHTVEHIYVLENGLVRSMQIRKPDGVTEEGRSDPS